MAAVIVQELEPGFWEVHEGARWWTVAHSRGNQGFLITSDTGRVIKQTGATGKRIIAAIYVHQQQ